MLLVDLLTVEPLLSTQVDESLIDSYFLGVNVYFSLMHSEFEQLYRVNFKGAPNRIETHNLFRI